jgi:predicted alpha/beta hydrolase
VVDLFTYATFSSVTAGLYSRVFTIIYSSQMDRIHQPSSSLSSSSSSKWAHRVTTTKTISRRAQRRRQQQAAMQTMTAATTTPITNNSNRGNKSEWMDMSEAIIHQHRHMDAANGYEFLPARTIRHVHPYYSKQYIPVSCFIQFDDAYSPPRALQYLIYT